MEFFVYFFAMIGLLWSIKALVSLFLLMRKWPNTQSRSPRRTD